jgi:hypothetical protein
MDCVAHLSSTVARGSRAVGVWTREGVTFVYGIVVRVQGSLRAALHENVFAF